MNDSTAESTTHVVTKRPDNGDRYARYAVCSCGWGSKSRRSSVRLDQDVLDHRSEALGVGVCGCTRKERHDADNNHGDGATVETLRNMDAGICNACGGVR